MDDYIGDHSGHDGGGGATTTTTSKNDDARYAKRLQRLQKKLHRSNSKRSSIHNKSTPLVEEEDFALPPLPPQAKLDCSFGDTPSRWLEAAQTPPPPVQQKKKKKTTTTIKRSSMDMLKSYFTGDDTTTTTTTNENYAVDNRISHHHSTSSPISAQRVASATTSTTTTARTIIHDEPPPRSMTTTTTTRKKKRSSLDMLKSYFHNHDGLSSDLTYYQEDDDDDDIITPSCWPMSHEEQQKLKQDRDRKEKVQRIRDTMKKVRSERQLQQQQQRQRRPRRTSLDHVSPGIHTLPQQQRVETKKKKKKLKKQTSMNGDDDDDDDDHHHHQQTTTKPPHAKQARRLSNQMYAMDSTRGVTVDLRRASMGNGTTTTTTTTTANHQYQTEVPSRSSSSSNNSNSEDPPQKEEEQLLNNDGQNSNNSNSSSTSTDFTSSSEDDSSSSDEHNYRSLVPEQFCDVNLNTTSDENIIPSKKQVKEALHRTASPNHPHPALELVPLYALLRYACCCCGCGCCNVLPFAKKLLLCCQAKSFWSQRVLPQSLAKIDVFLTIGQLALWSGLIGKFMFTLYFTLLDPNVTMTGYAAVVSLVLCIWTTCHHSLLTIPFGISLEQRGPFYHAWSTYVTLITSVLHTGVAFYYPDQSRTIQQFELQEQDTLTNLYPASSQSSLHEYEYQHTQELFEKSLALSHSWVGSTPQLGIFLLGSGPMNCAGSIMIIGLGLLTILTLLRQTTTTTTTQRRGLFFCCWRRLWQRSLKFVSIVTILVCSFYHMMSTSLWLPLLISIPWIMDLVLRKVVPVLQLLRNQHQHHHHHRTSSSSTTTTASLRLLPHSGSVMELSFLKTSGISYNPGQFVNVNIPSISQWDWQPCYISSSPEQVIVTLLLRKHQNDWTRSLYELLKKSKNNNNNSSSSGGGVSTTTTTTTTTNNVTVTISLEGPYGTTSLDLISEHQYSMVLLVSGGMGIAPMQSLGNQLLYEQSTGVRKIQQLSMIWMERDPVLEEHYNNKNNNNQKRRRRASSIEDIPKDHNNNNTVFSQYDDVEVASSGVGQFVPRHNSILEQEEQDKNNHETEVAATTAVTTTTTTAHPQGIASTLLSLFPPSRVTDDELEEMFRNMYYELEQPLLLDNNTTTTTTTKTLSSNQNNNNYYYDDNNTTVLPGSTLHHHHQQRWMEDDDDESVFTMSESFMGDTYNLDSTAYRDDNDDVLELNVYRLSKPPTGEQQQQQQQQTQSLLPFVHTELPNLPEIFKKLQHQALEHGERRVAVCVCAPPIVTLLVQKACVKYSSSSSSSSFNHHKNKAVTFDCHVQPWLEG